MTDYLNKAQIQLDHMDELIAQNREEVISLLHRGDQAAVDKVAEEVHQASTVAYSRAQALAAIDQAISLRQITQSLESIATALGGSR